MSSLELAMDENRMGFSKLVYFYIYQSRALYGYVLSRCGRVITDFEREAKTRYNFKFQQARRHWFYEIFKNDNVQGLQSNFIKIVIDPVFLGKKI